MRSLLTLSSRPSRRLALVALLALAATVINAVPAHAAAATHLALQNVATSITAEREADPFTVVAQDGSNQEDTSYGSTQPVTVTFTADCGDCFSITPHDNGNDKAYTFGLLTTGQAGHQDLSVTWKETASLPGTRTLTVSSGALTPASQSGITVLSNAPASLDVSPNVQTGATTGIAEAFNVVLKNPQGQTNPNPYAGTVTFSASCTSCFTITPNNGGANANKFTYNGQASQNFQLTWTTSGTGRTFTVAGSDLAAPAGDDSETQSGINVQQGATTTTSTTSTSTTTTSTTLAPRVAEPMIVTGAGAGGGPHVIARSADNLAVVMSFFAYDPKFTGGVRVATGDVNNDGFDDIITAPGPGGGPHIRVFSGKSGVLLAEFMAYAGNFTGGVFVAAGDVNGDSRADIITGADAGGGPHVRVFDAAKLGDPDINTAEIASFFAYDPVFHGGVRVAAGDFDNDNKADIVTSPGPGGGPHVIVRRGTDSSVLGQFMAYGGNFTGGVFVAADQGGEGLVYTGAGPGGGEHVRVLNLAGAEQLGFLASAGHDGALPAVGDSTTAASDVLVVARNVSVPKVGFFDFEDGSFLGDFPAYGAPVGVFVAVGVL